MHVNFFELNINVINDYGIIFVYHYAFRESAFVRLKSTIFKLVLGRYRFLKSVSVFGIFFRFFFQKSVRFSVSVFRNIAISVRFSLMIVLTIH